MAPAGSTMSGGRSESVQHMSYKNSLGQQVRNLSNISWSLAAVVPKAPGQYQTSMQCIHISPHPPTCAHSLQFVQGIHSRTCPLQEHYTLPSPQHTYNTITRGSGRLSSPHTHQVTWFVARQEVGAMADNPPELLFIFTTTQSPNSITWCVSLNHLCCTIYKRLRDIFTTNQLHISCAAQNLVLLE